MNDGLPGEPGAVAIRELPDPDGRMHRLAVFACPRGRGECVVPIKDAQFPRGWDYDGDEAAPTLSPSVLCHKCGWHGFLRAGRLVDA